MEEIIYMLFLGMVIGFLVGMALVFLYVGLRKLSGRKKKHRFQTHDSFKYISDRKVLDSGRNDHSADDFY